MRRSSIAGSKKPRSITNLDFHYDKSNDLLYAHKADTGVYSAIMVGDFHLEITKGGAIVGVEILNASVLLKEFGISRKLLENIERVDLKVVTTGNSLLVFLIIRALDEEKSAAITLDNLKSPLLQALAAES